MKIRVKKKSFGVTMFAMPDIAFLLLIFLILTVSTDESGNISLPGFKYLQDTDFPDTLVLNISPEGKYGIAGEYIGLQQLESALNRIPKETVIHLTADKQCRYKDVDKMLELLQKKGLLDIVLIMEEPKTSDNE